MRPLESVLVLVVIAAVAVRVARLGDERSNRVLAGVVVGLAVAQLGLEGFRWQLVALYAVAGALTAVSWSPAREVRRPRSRAAGWVGVALLAAGLPVLLPIPRLPVPDGPYAVGTTTMVATDESRMERYGPSPGGPRILALHLWYPAEPTGAAAPGWLGPETRRAVAGQYGLPWFFLDHLGLTATHAVRDAPLASGDEQFPVVVYSHGWNGFGRISPDQPERLASHGFVVIAPDHTFGALVSDLPGGLVPHDPAALPDEQEVGEAARTAASAALVATYAQDIRFVFDLLTVREPVALGMAGRIDVERIGVYGHSTGGGAAVAACQADARCDAVLGLDPWVVPVDPWVIGAGLSQPFVAMRSDGWVGEENDEVLYDLHSAGGASSTIMALEGANHFDFVALSQISPLARYLGFTGSIPAPIAREAIGALLVSFFDEHLRGGYTPIPAFDQVRIDAVRDR